MATDKEQEEVNGLEAEEGELEVLKREKGTLARALEARDITIADLEKAIAGKDSELIALKQAIDEADKKLADISDALAEAVASYKALVLKANPGVLAELITGDNVDEVNQSLENAQSLIARVRQEMEAEASRTKVPAGAPQRAPLDLSGLSPREKIQYAIGGKR